MIEDRRAGGIGDQHAPGACVGANGFHALLGRDAAFDPTSQQFVTDEPRYLEPQAPGRARMPDHSRQRLVDDGSDAVCSSSASLTR